MENRKKGKKGKIITALIISQVSIIHAQKSEVEGKQVPKLALGTPFESHKRLDNIHLAEKGEMHDPHASSRISKYV